MPRITEFHSFAWIEDNDRFEARALPHTLEMRAWLSLVGIPLSEASVAQTMTVIRATHRDRSAERLSLPKSAMP